MNNKQFFNNLSATYADVRKLDVKKINLKGENILDIIKRATPTIKHSQDIRETVTDDDRWGQYIETQSDGTIIIHDDWVTNPNASSSKAWNTSITKVEDNKAYVGESGDTFFANIQTEKIKDGGSMFYHCGGLTTFSSDLPNLTNGSHMFRECHSLNSFSSALPNLTNSKGMFFQCPLESFTSDLPSLTSGSQMFFECSDLISFTSVLPSLTDGRGMFQMCEQLNSFSSDLPSLTNGSNMFNGCSELNSFTSNLSSLTFGDSMFNGCSILTSFTSDLSNLTSGNSMFNDCNLDAESVMYIADTIKDITAEKQLYIDGTIPYVTYDSTTKKYSAPKGFMSDGRYVYTYNDPNPSTPTISSSNVGKLTLGINVSNNADTIQQQLEDFAKEATFDSWDVLKTYFSNKGWTVTFQYGGTSTSITYDLRNGEQIIPCPIFAKLVEADKDSAEYCTEDASTFYNIEWGHDVTDTSSYTQFDSLEDAMTSWNVFPKENIISTEE